MLGLAISHDPLVEVSVFLNSRWNRGKALRVKKNLDGWTDGLMNLKQLVVSACNNFWAHCLFVWGHSVLSGSCKTSPGPKKVES